MRQINILPLFLAHQNEILTVWWAFVWFQQYLVFTFEKIVFQNLTALKHIVLTIGLLCLCRGCCFAQKLPVVRYTSLQGLTGMQCMSVFRDSRGYIWVGTKSGLSRFNGEKFRNFHVKDGLLGDYVTVIGEDSKGYVWFTCRYKGLVRYDGQTFKAFRFPEAAPYYDNAIIGQNDEIFFKEEAKPSAIFQVVGDTVQPVVWKGLPKDQITAMLGYHKPTQSYLLLIGNGLYNYKNGKSEIIENIATNEGYFLKTQLGNDLMIIRRTAKGELMHQIWNGKELNTVLVVDANGKSKVLKTLNRDYIYNQLGTVYLLEKNTKDPVLVSYNTALNSSEQIVDGTAIHYLATEKGLIGIVNNGFRNFDEEEVPYTWSVVEDEKGGKYFVNYQQLPQYFDGRKLTTITAHLEPLKKKCPTIGQNEWYYHALKDKNNRLWFPNMDGIAVKQKNKWDFIPFKSSLVLAENKAQNTIISGSEDRIVFVENRPPYKLRVLTGSEPIFQGTVMTVAVAPDGAYWFGNYGVARYDSLRRKTTFYNRENHKIGAGSMMCLFFDNQNTLWAGSFSKGLFRYNAQTDAFERVFENWLDGMILFVEQLDNAHLLVADANNLYVVNMNQAKRDKNAAALKIFNHHNGFMGIEPGQLGSYKDAKGHIWITSGTVLSVLDPSKLDLKSKKITTFITQMDSITLPFVGKAPVQKLPNGQNNVSFVVEALGEDKPFETQFSYRVKGVQNDWSAWQSQDLITLTNLANEVYTLEVKSRNGINTTTGESEIAVIQFKVSLPFYRSPNFYKYASLVGLLLLLGLLYVWWRERTQNKQVRESDKQVRFLKSQAFLAQMNSHFINNVLGSIKYLVESQNTKEASDSLQKFADLIRKHLEASMLKEDSTHTIYEREIQLSEEIDFLRLYIELQQLRHQNLFEYDIRVDGKINTDSFRLPPLLFQPYVENAIVHGLHNKGGGGHLIISFVQINEEELLCTIEDDGVGRAKMKEIQAQSYRKYKSRGSELVLQRIEILNETDYNILINTTDRVGGGTVVTIKVGYK